MQLVLISPPVPEARHLALLPEMLRLGISRVHLRWPGCALGQARSLLEAMPRELRQKAVVHQHHELAEVLGLLGCHWKSGMRPMDFQESNYRTCSVHDTAEMFAVRGYFESIFLSPIFPSISKPGYVPVVGNWRLAEFREQEASLPGRAASRLCALGGVSAQNLGVCAAMGFDEAAVLGAVWESSDPLCTVADLCSSVEALA